MSSFAAAFRDIVMPELRRRARFQALAVSRGRCSFIEASGAVWFYARRRGATHLPDGIVLELDDWIDTTILRTMAEIEDSPEIAKAIVDEELGAACPQTT